MPRIIYRIQNTLSTAHTQDDSYNPKYIFILQLPSVILYTQILFPRNSIKYHQTVIIRYMCSFKEKQITRTYYFLLQINIIRSLRQISFYVLKLKFTSYNIMNNVLYCNSGFEITGLRIVFYACPVSIFYCFVDN